MPSHAPSPESVAPTPEPHPLSAENGELWTRPNARLNTPNRRRRKTGPRWRPLLLLAIGGVLGFYGGIAYEKNRQRETSSGAAASPAPALAAAETPAPEPDLPLPPSPPVSAAGVAVRLERIKTRQPDVRDVLKYARELRRVATLPVADAANFPTDAQVARLVERFDWTDSASPLFHRPPLLLVLGCSNEPPGAPGQALSQQCADRLAQALAQHGITAPIYTCGLGSKNDVAEIEPAGAASGLFVEVWVAFTLF